MNTTSDKDTQLEIWLANDVPPDLLRMPLSDELSATVVDKLKLEVDRYWSIDPNFSLKYADRIIAIGRARNDRRQEALGLMARGDSLKFLGNLQEAWQMLERSGDMYRATGDEMGWARTRIGRLWLGLKLNHVNETLDDVNLARNIFLKYGEQEKIIRLEINTAYIHTQRGDQQEALRLYQSALSRAEEIGATAQPHIGMIYMNLGVVYEALGDFPLALASYERARALYAARNETRNLANVDLNIANIAQAQGHYRQALRLLYGMLERGLDQFPEEEKAVKRALIVCFLYLNRFTEARDMAMEVADKYRSSMAAYDLARTLLHLATAEAEQSDFAGALNALQEARSIFEKLNAITWMMITRLRYGQVALYQSNFDMARDEALAVVSHFKEEGLQFHESMANLLIGQSALAASDYDSAALMGQRVLQFAQRYNVPSLRYAAHFLMGQVAVARNRINRAIRSYQAAIATIDRVQSSLTITLRSGFLENKNEAGRQLITLHLGLDQIEHAFETLERNKSQILLNYIGDREQFQWTKDHSESRHLLEELETLRVEHHMLYRLAHEVPQNNDQPYKISPEKALGDALMCERRMRAITEQLYLYGKDQQRDGYSQTIGLQDIQKVLDKNTLLIEYFTDGKCLWAFVLDGKGIVVHQLPVTIEKIDQLIRQFQANASTALKFDPQAQGSRRLTHLGQMILQRLYSLLLEPLQPQQYERKRLIIVPYGALHYLPFNLLHDGTCYLIERFEVVILPAASLAVRPTPERRAGAQILANSWNGRLPYTQMEAQLIHQIVGGNIYMERDASRLVLQNAPSQILHIATHGQHRLDQPDLSFLELSDGQLYADDLLQQDLSYELVTLSACETGRANVAADEELIGIGRGLLYAGAGALVLSLWPVADVSTVHLMEQLYGHLKTGRSKAYALRQAQLSFLSQDRQIHPAFWGAFQLIGNASPLSTST